MYCYPSEHYAYWREELPGFDLPWGVFGENLTTEGLLEPTSHRRQVSGGAQFLVTQPRQPCFAGDPVQPRGHDQAISVRRQAGVLRRGVRGRNRRRRSIAFTARAPTARKVAPIVALRLTMKEKKRVEVGGGAGRAVRRLESHFRKRLAER